MKRLILLLLLVVNTTMISQNYRINNGFVTAISLGIDPQPMFDDTSTGGLDLNAKIIFGKENSEQGLAVEYFDSLDYLSYGWYYDFIILGRGTSYDQPIQAMLGPELLLISRFGNRKAKLPTGFFGVTAGINGTVRWNISEYFGMEGILNYKYRTDIKTLYKETRFNKLVPMSVRINFVIILK